MVTLPFTSKNCIFIFMYNQQVLCDDLFHYFSKVIKCLFCNIIILNLSLEKTLGPNQTLEDELLGPTYKFTAHSDQQVQSMVSTDNFLVTATTGEIVGWDWSVVTSNKASKVKSSWTIQIPVDK